MRATCRAYSAHTLEIRKEIQDETRTPFIKGMRDAGSVAMDASSRKTTGRSSTLSATLAEVMQVVQILHDVRAQKKKYGNEHVPHQHLR
jgi:hypothetical protein